MPPAPATTRARSAAACSRRRVTACACAGSVADASSPQEEADAENDSGFAAGLFSYDAFEIDAQSGRIDFFYSHRDGRSRVALDRFQTAVHIRFPGGVAPPGAAAAAFCCGMASLPWLWMGVPTSRILVRAWCVA